MENQWSSWSLRISPIDSRRFQLLAPLWGSVAPIRAPSRALVTGAVHVDVGPDSLARAGFLDKAGRLAISGETEGLVVALVSMGIVFTHLAGEDAKHQESCFDCLVGYDGCGLLAVHRSRWYSNSCSMKGQGASEIASEDSTARWRRAMYREVA